MRRYWSGRVSVACWPFLGPLLWALLAIEVRGQNASPQNAAPVPAPPILVPAATRPQIDGDLADWPDSGWLHIDSPGQVLTGAANWSGPADASLDLLLSYDANCLYLAGIVHDDAEVLAADNLAAGAGDSIELVLGDDEHGARADDLRLLLIPRSAARPWTILDAKSGAPLQSGPNLTGFEVKVHPLERDGYRFEAALPFH